MGTITTRDGTAIHYIDPVYRTVPHGMCTTGKES